MTSSYCKDCRWWDGATSSDRAPQNAITGLCRGALPTVDKRSGLALWPFVDAYDWCRGFEDDPSRPKQEESDSDLPF